MAPHTRCRVQRIMGRINLNFGSRFMSVPRAERIAGRLNILPSNTAAKPVRINVMRINGVELMLPTKPPYREIAPQELK